MLGLGLARGSETLELRSRPSLPQAWCALARPGVGRATMGPIHHASGDSQGMPRSSFRIDWVLRDQLALGPAPRRLEHLGQLERAGVQAVLSLCDAPELPMPVELGQRFLWARQVLPDHRAGRYPTAAELEAALAELGRLRREAGAVFVHCVASMERSPLVCLAWLMRERGLSRLQALDYLMQVHPGTNPLPGQLELLA